MFFFNDTATAEIYTSFPTRRSSDLHLLCGGVPGLPRPVVPLDLHGPPEGRQPHRRTGPGADQHQTPVLLPDRAREGDRKSTRLNSSHANISYAVFCLKKKKTPLHKP